MKSLRRALGLGGLESLPSSHRCPFGRRKGGEPAGHELARWHTDQSGKIFDRDIQVRPGGDLRGLGPAEGRLDP